ncbi:nitronate monooxygenase family protein [Motiliproteus sp. SC1-56]|uniref:NAD(P)H-dependent flavin oxidoreductase n=1 Tax=Motiliproteus sp. SC1-56 TaxID=2799565 RepID=UPI001A8E5BC2|nr:nitronate monooxygenase family protein [Motiliproteus sp. SC1-56]
MSVSETLTAGLKLPAIAAPMFLVSGPELVINTCKAGVVGTFPALNQRTSEGFEAWLLEIEAALQAFEAQTGEKPAPYGVNLIVHHSNPRVKEDLAICVKHRVPLVITSLGANREVVEAVHSYGGKVIHDVINLRHARKAAEAGVDGLIAVAAGAGGHAGTLSPFALVNEIREFFDGTLVLAGALSKGSDIAAAQLMGADLAYLGTRFINTRESRAGSEYQAMVNAAKAADIVYTPKISGVAANFLRESLARAGMLPENLDEKKHVDFGAELQAPEEGQKAWKDIWSAGQGVGSISDAPPVAELVARLRAEYCGAIEELESRSRCFRGGE